MTRSAIRLGVLMFVCLVAGTSADDGQADAPRSIAALEIQKSQVLVALDQHDLYQTFRGTVLASSDSVLTVLTTARYLGGDEGGRPARLLLEDGALEGIVLSVAINPAYQPPGAYDVARKYHYFMRSWGGRYQARRGSGTPNAFRYYSLLNRETPGADNAILRIWFPTRQGDEERPIDRAFRAIQPARWLTSVACPGASGGSLTAHVVDSGGREHVFPAGNFQNPRTLEWGHSYVPARVDSGIGVFTYREGPDGRPVLVLIGVLVGPDRRGACASLVDSGMPWVARALAESVPTPTDDDNSRLKPPPAGR